jgi:hypothetical protein
MADILDVLSSALGDPTRVQSNGEASFYCPSCNHKNPKLMVNTKKFMYNCWICGLSGRRNSNENPYKVFGRLLYKIGKYTEAKRLLRDFGVVTTQSSKELDNLAFVKQLLDMDNTPHQEIIRVALPNGYRRLYRMRNEKFYGYGWEYLQSRGFVEDDLLKYGVMYNITDQRVLFPSYSDELEMNYFVSRTIKEGERKPYDNPEFSKNSIIFNEHLIDWTTTLYLVEGVFDAIISRKNTTPLLGSSLTKHCKLFGAILEKRPRVVLALDPDASTNQLKIMRLLIRHNIDVECIDWKDETRDIAQMGSHTFSQFGTIKHNLKMDVVDKLKGDRNENSPLRRRTYSAA